MTDLLIEVWEYDDLCQSMGPVREFKDVRHRSKAVLVHSFRAGSFAEAQYLYDLWCGIDTILPDDAFDEPFTPEEREVQDEYLRRRMKWA
jgi:hypothetical protein